MKTALRSVASELRRLKREGVTELAVSDEALEMLRTEVGRRSSEPSSETEIRAAAPEHVTEAPEASRGPAKESGLVFRSESSSKPEASKETESTLPSPRSFELPEGDKQTRWNFLRELVLSCPVCNEHVREGCKIVFGVGNLDASIFFCGEAPGADEEIQGEPFVGRAGELLTKMIRAMGLAREDVYIGNIMNWRPEMPTPVGNRPPTPEEMAYCLPYLKAQIEVVKPKVIVALGGTAATGLLGEGAFRSLSQIRGHWQEFADTPLMPTYHPSYLLRNGSNRTKRAVWEDLLKVMERVELPISDKQRGYFL